MLSEVRTLSGTTGIGHGIFGRWLLSLPCSRRVADIFCAHTPTTGAIENGVTLRCQSDNALSLVMDPYGWVIATMDHFNTADRVMVAQVPVQSALTHYPYIKDAFAWVVIVVIIGLVVWGRWRWDWKIVLE